ncbi:MAG: DHH family phosphoesterase [archaeon]|nr:DHH family phosphoesterase [archaeon]MCR4323893.1 DHH family phosphoesterase [Nanoarchaeota archaeon]
MLKEVKRVTKEFLEAIKDKPVRIISHYDTDGITSAAILTKTLQRLDKKFTLRIVKSLDREILEKELLRQPKEILVFSDLASGSLEYFQNLKGPIFILDHHEIDKTKLNANINIINPHLTNKLEENNCSGAGACYLLSKEISEKNKDLSYLAVIGMIGDRQESNLSKINQQFIKDSENLQIKKGLILYPATRPLRRALEYSTSPYIPGVTGNGPGVINLLREVDISAGKSLLELSKEEMSRLITAVMMRQSKKEKQKDTIGNLYILKFFNTQEDVREISTLINSCSRLGFSDVAVSYCLGNEKAKERAMEIYTNYRQELVSGLRVAEKMNKIDGKGFVILNAKDQIKDVIVGTICSMLSSSQTYEEGTILIGMAYNKDKIKVSARMVGREGRNLKEFLEKTIITFKNGDSRVNVEVGGHHFAAGCLLDKDREEDFIEALKKNLEVEIMKV